MRLHSHDLKPLRLPRKQLRELPSPRREIEDLGVLATGDTTLCQDLLDDGGGVRGAELVVVGAGGEALGCSGGDSVVFGGGHRHRGGVGGGTERERVFW